VVIELIVIVELWEQLLDWERELDVRENALLTREHAMMEAEQSRDGAYGVRRCSRPT
jgi:hypothetical protein